MKISIIGAGLAGGACAYFLSEGGAQCTLYDAPDYLDRAASGNARGLYNPRFFAEYSVEAEFYARAFEAALLVFEGFGDSIHYTPCGALHLMNTEQKQRRFGKMLESWPWDAGMMRKVDAAEASALAGVALAFDALYLPRSGMVCPRRLCETYLERSKADLRLGAPVDSVLLQTLLRDSDYVILACGAGVRSFAAARDLPLNPVRGQVSLLRPSAQSQALRSVLCYGGYMTPRFDGVHCVGSTFDRGVESCALKASDDAENLHKMIEALPALDGEEFCVQSSRAAVRLAAAGHFPVIGQLEDRLYISAAHGSHGILSSLMGAQILAAQLCGGEAPVSDSVVQKLSPQRFS